jgi:integral membrane protein (TIGR00529 family)
MNIFLVVALAMILILYLLRRHTPIGLAILAGGILIWAVKTPELHYLPEAFIHTWQLPRTYDLLGALYLVMCLEIELRTSGTLDGMVHALQRIFASAKVTLAVMPAFLGLLPSLGGARFSAPIVAAAARDANITADQKATINFWFRHIFEFSNPIIPGMIMACSIAQVPYSAFISHLAWLTALAFGLGWLVIIRPLKMDSVKKDTGTPAERRKNLLDIAFSLAPVIANFALAVFFKLNASISMLIVVLALIPILLGTGRTIKVKDVFVDACDWKMFLNVIAILFFIQLLTDTHALDEIVTGFRNAPLPVPVIIAGVTFVIGVLTGMSQGHVAIIMPIVAALSPGDLNLAGVAMAFGIAGQMLTPTHMCLLITLDYFKADFFQTLKPIMLLEAMILTIFSVYTYFTW